MIKIAFNFFYKKVWVNYSDLSSFVVGYAWQLICQFSPWLLYNVIFNEGNQIFRSFLWREPSGTLTVQETHRFFLPLRRACHFFIKANTAMSTPIRALIKNMARISSAPSFRTAGYFAAMALRKTMTIKGRAGR